VENLDIHDARGRDSFAVPSYRYVVLSALKSFLQASTIGYLQTELEKRVRSRTQDLEESNIRLLEALNTLEEDQEAGRRIQYRMLPEQEKSLKDYRFSRYLISSTSLSGDFIDYFEIDEDTLGFYIADVSGHGISSAFVTVLLTNYIHTFLRNYRHEEDQTILQPAHLMERLNTELLREGLGKYITIYYGIIRTDSNRLFFANAGQFPCPIVRSQTGITMNLIHDWRAKDTPLGTKYAGEEVVPEKGHKETTRIDTKGPPIGMFRNARFREYELILPPEFTMLMVSDGILEILPQERLDDKLSYLESLMGTKSPTIQKILGKLELSEEAQVPDDVTFLMVEKRRNG
jgi:serine phosphatase RsbU (regulator of sigma subunit)